MGILFGEISVEDVLVSARYPLKSLKLPVPVYLTVLHGFSGYRDTKLLAAVILFVHSSTCMGHQLVGVYGSMPVYCAPMCGQRDANMHHTVTAIICNTWPLLGMVCISVYNGCVYVCLNNVSLIADISGYNNQRITTTTL
jgi:hypothetical protein